SVGALQRVDGMPLLGEIFQPAREKPIHPQTMLEHRVRRRERPQNLPEVPTGMAVQRLGHMRVGIHPQLRRRRSMAGMRVDEVVGQLQFQRVRVAFLYMQMHHEPVIDIVDIATRGELLRREQPRQPVIVLRIPPPQALEAYRQQAVASVQYGAHGWRANSRRLSRTSFARCRSGRRSCWRSPRSTRAWYSGWECRPAASGD